MNIRKLSDEDLHHQTKQSALDEKTCTLKVLKFIEEIHRRKLFIDLGYSTLMKYMVGALGYSEAESWLRIESMKLMTKFPSIEQKVEQGLMSLTNVSLLNEALRQSQREPERNESKEEIILKALDNCELPSRKFKETLNIRTTSKRIVLNERLLKKMGRIMGTMSEVELIESLVDEKIKSSELSKSLRAPKKQSSNSRYIAKYVQRIIFTRAKYQCEFESESGERCQERRNLQMDHIKPYALGGDNSPENMRILCSGHNQARAYKTFS